MMENRIIIIADDFTGANDTGVQMRKQGIATNVIIGTGECSGNAVYDTESRIVSPQEAYSRVYRVVNSVMQHGGCQFLYKKVDSTLRGNVLSEIKAAANAYKPELILFAPALPKLGRTTEQAVQCVQGTPLLETEIAQDPRNPIQYDRIDLLLTDSLDMAVTHHTLDSIRQDELDLDRGAHTFDALESSDMVRIAQHGITAGKRTLWIGSAGLAAGYLSIVYPKAPVLAVVGSVSGKVMAQMAYAEQQGVPIISIDMKQVLSGSGMAPFIKDIAAHLQQGQDLIMTAAKTRDVYEDFIAYGKNLGQTTEELAELTKNTMGDITEAVLAQCDVSGLFLTGGDTAIGVIKRLGATGARIEREILTGIVLSRLYGGSRDGLPIVTKAGAFGADGDVYFCMNRLKEDV